MISRRGFLGALVGTAAAVAAKPVVDLVEPARTYFFIGDPVKAATGPKLGYFRDCFALDELADDMARMGDAGREPTFKIEDFRLTLDRDFKALGLDGATFKQAARDLAARIDAEIIASYEEVHRGILSRMPVDTGQLRADHSLRFRTKDRDGIVTEFLMPRIRMTPPRIETADMGRKLIFKVAVEHEPIRPIQIERLLV